MQNLKRKRIEADEIPTQSISKRSKQIEVNNTSALEDNDLSDSFGSLIFEGSQELIDDTVPVETNSNTNINNAMKVNITTEPKQGAEQY